MEDKKIFQLHLAIAIEATDGNQAYEKLLSDETIEHIKKMIVSSKDKIEAHFNEKDEEVILN